MSFLCLHNLAWLASPPVTLHAPLLTIVPRVLSHGDLVWADLRGLPARDTTERVRNAFTAHNALSSSVRCGVASSAIAAEVAARHSPQSVTYVRDGYDRDFLAPFPVSVLGPERAIANLLDGTGVEMCRDLARLSQEEVEVRFGSEGVKLWRFARADDGRRIFGSIPRGLPVASLEWTDYAIRRAERLVFVINALFGNVCEALKSRGEGALAVTISFALANRATLDHPIRAARATAGQTAWMRLVRLEIERIVFPDAVTGITLRVDAISRTGGRQGDAFDRGFGSESAAEEALGQLMDDQGSIAVEPENSAHPLMDRRTGWTSVSATRVMERAHIYAASLSRSGEPALTLQLLPEPRRISVATFRRRGDDIPRTYSDARVRYDIIEAAGPDSVSGGRWDDAYAREYFRCVVENGGLVWLYRDTRSGVWYLHGWWD